MEHDILQHPVVQKSIRRLKKMGLRLYVEKRGEDAALMVVEPKSIVETVVRMTDRAITYQKHLVVYDEVKGAVIIAFWRGEEPQWVSNLRASRLMTSGQR